ncbi:hypothetical protein AAFF_G00029940 [Aldrovandia affinis]|uniref:Uncharacterized protein n=1 Tax=Aldrovandia affinis TaxID=143900 RepID=A0AAD7WG55_9TELE|nr:hypothetical protein AAFF_G00029940 [Aldrovandia affinis]
MMLDYNATKGGVGKALVVPHIERRQHMPRTPASAATVREIQERATTSTPVPEVAAGGKRKRCQAARMDVTSIVCRASMTCGMVLSWPLLISSLPR